MSNPGRLAFIDLDGTLLGPDKSVSAANLQALGYLRAAGIQIVIASGRHHRNIRALDPTRGTGWVLSSQGSVVRHEPSGELLLEMNLKPEQFLELWELSQKLEVSLIAYHRDGACVERCTRWTELYARNSGWTPRVADLRSLTLDGFQKLIWSDDPVRIADVAAEVERDLFGRYQMVVNDPELLEFLTPGANKAAGAMALASRLEIDPAHTFAFGDGTNDIELLSWAGVSVAMDHGREGARRAARFISPPGPPESALARAVELALSV